MKYFRREFGHDYPNYRFGYCEYAQLEPQDDPADLYAQGYLPYSAGHDRSGLFYMARSARIALRDFAFSSENRRIAKRFDGRFSRRAISIAEAHADERIRDLFLSYFAQRHGTSVMPPERYEALLAWPLPLRMLVYEEHGTLVAAVFEVRAKAFGHFWFSAYDLQYVEQSLGMWLMLDAAKNAQDDGIAQYYLGTVYGTKALYKTNLAPLAYWDGAVWNDDAAHLRDIARRE